MLTVKTKGFRELERMMFQLKASTAKSNVREAMREAFEPMAAHARSLAPVDSGDLVEGIEITGKGIPPAPRRDPAEMMMGPGRNPQAIFQEFGTFKEPPQPFMRPAWDAGHIELLDRFGVFVWDRITRAVARNNRGV